MKDKKQTKTQKAIEEDKEKKEKLRGSAAARDSFLSNKKHIEIKNSNSRHVFYQGKHMLKNGVAQIWGYYKPVINIGDVITLPGDFNVYTVGLVVEKRDHCGRFKNPKDAEDAFFRVNCDVFNPVV